jgi:hypothetical protein
MRGIAACVACFWWSDNPDYLEFTYHNSCTDAIMSGQDPFKILDRIKILVRRQPEIARLAQRAQASCIREIIFGIPQPDCSPSKNPFADLIPKQPRQ